MLPGTQLAEAMVTKFICVGEERQMTWNPACQKTFCRKIMLEE